VQKIRIKSFIKSLPKDLWFDARDITEMVKHFHPNQHVSKNAVRVTICELKKTGALITKQVNEGAKLFYYRVGE
jgi:N-acetylmuramic acid 6-phosphate (MurNAc-6-P) etherase